MRKRKEIQRERKQIKRETLSGEEQIKKIEARKRKKRKKRKIDNDCKGIYKKEGSKGKEKRMQ